MSIFVHIIEVTTGLEAHALRYAAECWGASVGVTWVGNAQQIVDVLSSKPVHDVLIISGHGDERGLLLPPLAAEIKERYPYNDVITPANFAEFVRLDGNIVINSSCSGGMPELAQVFLEARTRAYIGPEDYPHGSAALMYVLLFCMLTCTTSEMSTRRIAWQPRMPTTGGNSCCIVRRAPYRKTCYAVGIVCAYPYSIRHGM